LTEAECSQLIWEELAPEFSSITIIIDALDECEDNEVLLRWIRDIQKKAPESCRIKVFLSTRKGIKFPSDFPDIRELDLDEKQHLTKNDLVHFITTQVKEREQLNLGSKLLDGNDSGLEEKLTNALIYRSQGM